MLLSEHETTQGFLVSARTRPAGKQAQKATDLVFDCFFLVSQLLLGRDICRFSNSSGFAEGGDRQGEKGMEGSGQ